MAKCHEIAEFFFELSTNPWEPKKQTRPEMQKPDEQKNELVFLWAVLLDCFIFEHLSSIFRDYKYS